MSIAKNLRAGGKMFLLSAIALGMALPAYAQSQGGFNSTTPSVTFSAEGTGVLTINKDTSAAFTGPVTFGGPITEGATTINKDGSMIVGSNNGTTPTLVVNGPIKPGSSNIVSGNSCTTEGALGYDLSNHEPVYCNDKGAWTLMGGGLTVTETVSATDRNVTSTNPHELCVQSSAAWWDGDHLYTVGFATIHDANGTWSTNDGTPGSDGGKAHFNMTLTCYN